MLARWRTVILDSSRKLSVGVIGLGLMGIQHAAILNSLDSVNLVCLCESEPFLARVASNLMSKVRLYRDYMEMTDAEDLDAVFITTPTPSHTTVARRIFEANDDISVFIEKPLGASYKDAANFADYVSREKRRVCIGFQKRYVGTYRKAKQILETGELGQVLSFKAHHYTSDVTREGNGWRFEKGIGGVTRDFAPHLLDLLIWFFGMPVSCQSLVQRIHSREVEDFVHSDLVFEGDVIGSIEACWSFGHSKSPDITIEIRTRGGFIAVSDDRITTWYNPGWTEGGPNIQAGYSTAYSSMLTASVPYLISYPEYTIQDQSFLESVKYNRPPPYGVEDAVKVNQLVDMILSDGVSAKT